MEGDIHIGEVTVGIRFQLMNKNRALSFLRNGDDISVYRNGIAAADLFSAHRTDFAVDGHITVDDELFGIGACDADT